METASPQDSAVMETTTAWIIQMRPVFMVTFVFYLPKSILFTSKKWEIYFAFRNMSSYCVEPHLIVMVNGFKNSVSENRIMISRCILEEKILIRHKL